MEKTHIVEIQNEYARIDKNWLNLHYKTTVALVLLSVFVECFLGWFIVHSDELNTTPVIFTIKFIIVPAFLNLTCVYIDYRVMGSEKLLQEKKIYVVSLLFVVICFVLFTVHIYFTNLYFIFAIPIILTTIYANYRLTIITSAMSTAAVILSEVFIKWDIDKVSIFDNTLRRVDFFIALFILAAFSAVCMVVIRFEKEKNAASIQKEMERHQLQEKLYIDELTGIYNRKALHNAVKDMEEDESESSYIFVMLDIDNFKMLNDNLGHIFGDRCLIELGKIMKAHCLEAIPFRYGGDEFCILFKNRTVDEAVGVCEKIQRAFHQVSVGKISGIALTASFGVSTYTRGMDSAKLIVNTDKALYEAKTVKNTIRVFQSE